MPDQKAMCKLCKGLFSRKWGSTKSMWGHLQHKHINEFNRLKGIESVDESSTSVCYKYRLVISSNFKQLSMKNFVKRISIISEQQKSDEFLLKQMIRHNIAFTFVDGPETKDFFSALFPNCEVGI